MEVTTSAEALRRQRAALGGSATNAGRNAIERHMRYSAYGVRTLAA